MKVDKFSLPDDYLRGPSIRDIAEHHRTMDLYDRGLLDAREIIMSNTVRHGPAALHQQAWLKALKTHADDIDPNRLPSLADAARQRGTPELYHDFLWSPEGAWTGFARLPECAQFDQEVEYRLRGYGEPYIIKPWAVEGRSGLIRSLVFLVTIICRDTYYRHPSGRGSCSYSLSFLDYDMQAYFAKLVEQ